MTTYKFYFYHLKGIKIGCTINPARRFIQNTKKYGNKFKHTILLVKETTIEDASIIEATFAKEYGYVNHSLYKQTFENSMINKDSIENKTILSKTNWLKNGKCTDEYRLKMSKKIKRRNSKLSDKEKEFFSATGQDNPAYGKNYLLDKTKDEKEDIKKKKQLTNELNKENHLHRGGAGAIYWNGKIYKSINSAVKKIGYSFKYIKRRILSSEYEECYFV